ncbi:hypothetical protein ACS0TY_017626 [Phlomoides rotata]
MGKKASIVMFLGVVYLRICLAASINRSFIDESSLLALKNQMNSDIFANWSQETSFCSWIGVTCSRRRPRVTGLKLSNMQIRGSIGREIGNLSFLTYLDIRNNSIIGQIPAEIGNLRRLRYIDMAQNHLGGRIPSTLGLLTKLQNLSLADNSFSGDIPRSLSACLQLKEVSLSYNNLTGIFPSWFGNLSELQQLVLQRNLLTGELPLNIFNTSSLIVLNVGDNQISGTIPIGICNQNRLQQLVLSRNLYVGEIPSTIARCHSLQVLSLTNNKLSGELPPAIWNLSTIRHLSLGRNNFTGTIPPSIGNLSNLETFVIAENSFHGTVPSEIRRLSRLSRLNLGLNKLNGEVPESIFNLSSLRIFSLQFNNNLSGKLPFSIDKGLPNLVEIYLSVNRFYGEIPVSISNLSSLRRIDIATNMFTGYIPTNLGNLLQLQVINLAENQLKNNMSKSEQDFISSLTTCKNLIGIRMSSNPITGVLPESLGSGNVSASLERFLANYCSIESPLPDQIGNLSKLLWLGLRDNELSGVIPATLGNFKMMQLLDISGNKFQGSVPEFLCNLKYLTLLDLSKNNLSGQLPSCLGNLPLLSIIDLGENSFSSNVPSFLWFMKQLERMNLSNNYFDGTLPGEIGNLNTLLELDLSGNMLSGEIPTNISQLQRITYLSLSNNKFNGSIYPSIAGLNGLQHLDLSSNNLSGPIPISLEGLRSLSYFNVSFNQLSGKIPDGGPFANFTAEFFVGNKGLCGAPRFEVKECKRSMPKSSRKNKLLKYILAPIASVVVVAAIILVFVLSLRGRKLLPVSLFELPFKLMHERISYREILRATSNFDGENLIGRGSSGSVYKGIFSSEMVAAVKVFDLDVRGAMKSFDKECEIMRNVRHRNLVKIITSCSNLEFKALVMMYMSNGNLQNWLYSADFSLNIVQRFGIMIDVAAAIEYLHEGYTSPIVHCDLKPNNILLDEDMIAHVGDFGIAKLLTEEQRMQQTKTLGTIGYIAPEYGSEGLVSTMADVYSYGILLMEVFSRRKPTDEMFSGELTMRRWVSESFPNSAMQIIDHDLLNMADESNRARHESCLTSTIELALECSADLAEARPNMKDVLVRISKIKADLSNQQV